MAKEVNIDPLDRSNAHLRKYFEGKSFLIVDPSKTIRPIIKKLMVELKASQVNKAPETYEEFENLIRSNSPHFVFTTEKYKGRSVEALVDIHTELRTDRLQSGFYVISENNSLSNATANFDSEVDALLTAPFTKQSLYTALFRSFHKKTKPSDYEKILNEGRIELFQEDYDSAKMKFMEAKLLGKKPVKALYYLGDIQYRLKNFEKACEYFEEGLTIKEDHFRSLNKYLKASLKINDYEKAYAAASTMLDNYPISAEQIPTFIKLSIANKKYEDIFRYAELFTALEEREDDIHKHIAAGLVICGKYFLQVDEIDQAKETMMKAADMARGNYQILRSCCMILIEFKIFSVVDEILMKLGEYHEFSDEYKIFEYEVMSHYGKPAKIVKEGMDFIQQGVKTVRIYDAIIKSSIDLERKPHVIEDLVIEAKKAFPGSAQHFEDLAATHKKPEE